MAYPNLKQSFWLMALLLLINAGLMVPVTVVSTLLGRSFHMSIYTMWLVGLGSFVLTARYAQRRTDRSWSDILLFKPVPWKLYFPLAVSIVGLGIACSDPASAILYLIPIPEMLHELLDRIFGKETPLPFLILWVVIDAALTEEIFYRGIILGGLLAQGTRTRAIVWSAILFVLAHGNPWQLPTAFTLGLVFAWWVVLTGSLLPAVAGHALNNLLALTVGYLEIFGPMDDYETVVFLPWWLNAIGIVLAAIGLWWFNQIAKRESSSLENHVQPEQADAPDNREPV